MGVEHPSRRFVAINHEGEALPTEDDNILCFMGNEPDNPEEFSEG